MADMYEDIYDSVVAKSPVAALAISDDDYDTTYNDVMTKHLEKATRQLSLRGRMEERAETADRSVKSRVDLAKVLWDELKYNPLARKDLNVYGKSQQMQVKPYATVLKAAGAASQRIESAIANRLKGLQEGEISPVAQGMNMVRGLTTEPTHEYGDVLARSRIPGVSNPQVAAAGGLGLSAITPGPDEAIRAITKGTRAVGKGITSRLGRWSEKAGKGYVQAMGASEEGAERAFARKFVDIPADVTESGAAKRLDKLRSRAVTGAQKFEDDVQEEFGKVLEKESSKRVAVEIVDEVGNNSLTQGVKQLLGKADVTDVEGAAINMPGAAALSSIVKQIDTAVAESGGYLTVGDLRRWMKPLRSLASNERLGEVYAAANELRSDLAKVVASASPEMATASKKYSSMVKTLHGVPQKTVGALSALRMSESTGEIPLVNKGYYGMSPKSQQSLERLGTRIRPTYGFLEDLKNASYVSELASAVPKKGASLAAIVTFAVKAPWMIPILYAAGSLLTPRTVGKGYGKMYRQLGRLQGVISSPGGQAVNEIVNRFVAAGAARGATREAFSQGGSTSE